MALLRECGVTPAFKSPLSTWDANGKRGIVLYLGESPKLLCIGGTLYCETEPTTARASGARETHYENVSQECGQAL